MERRLGRGLGSLLGGQTEQTSAETEAGEPQGPVRTLAIAEVRPNPNQPRKVFDSAALEELRDSIRNHGILQPICVRRTQAGGYEIVAGERRWRAARLAGLQEIPAAILDDVDDRRLMELALVENVQRADLDPIEKAQAFKLLIQELGLTQEQVASRVGMKRSSVANHIRLLDLPAEVQEAVTNGLITMGHAKVLLGQDEKVARKALGRTVREDLSVRQLEGLMKGSPASTPTASTDRATRKKESWATEFEGRLREKLGTPVRLQNSAGYRGRIIIEYSGREDLERLMESMAPADRLD